MGRVDTESVVGTEFIPAEVSQWSGQVIRAFSRGSDLDPLTVVREAASMPGRFLGQAYSFGDTFFKVAAYLKKTEGEGKSPRQAVREIYDYFANYAELAPATRALRVSPLGAPFISFTAEILRIWGNAFKHPATALKWFKWHAAIPGGLTALGLISSGITPSEWWESRKFFPKYMRERWPGMVPLPFRDANGNLQVWDFTYDLPLGELIYGGEKYKLWELATFQNPLFRAAIKVITNTGPSTGLPIQKPGEPLHRAVTREAARDIPPPLFPGGYLYQQMAEALKGARPSIYQQPRRLPQTIAGAFLGTRIRSLEPGLAVREQKRMAWRVTELEREMNRLTLEMATGRLSGADFRTRIQEIRKEIETMTKGWFPEQAQTIAGKLWPKEPVVQE